MSEISIAEVDQALAAMSESKKKYYDSDKSDAHKAEFKENKNRLNELRKAWKLQEEAAGRRGLVGGDATKAED